MSSSKVILRFGTTSIKMCAWILSDMNDVISFNLKASLIILIIWRIMHDVAGIEEESDHYYPVHDSKEQSKVDEVKVPFVLLVGTLYFHCGVASKTPDCAYNWTNKFKLYSLLLVT